MSGGCSHRLFTSYFTQIVHNIWHVKSGLYWHVARPQPRQDPKLIQIYIPTTLQRSVQRDLAEASDSFVNSGLVMSIVFSRGHRICRSTRFRLPLSNIPNRRHLQLDLVPGNSIQVCIFHFVVSNFFPVHFSSRITTTIRDRGSRVVLRAFLRQWLPRIQPHRSLQYTLRIRQRRNRFQTRHTITRRPKHGMEQSIHAGTDVYTA